MVAEFDRRRKIVVEGLNRLSGVSCITPKGAFYAFPNVSRPAGRRRRSPRRCSRRPASRRSAPGFRRPRRRVSAPLLRQLGREQIGGSKTWVLRYEHQKRERWMGLGSAEFVSLA